ncbi:MULTISPECIES: fumarylacetoacetate hydrolase family protein [Microbacterium]|uniref:2-keto-4-pentenoate hydratase/2-oxohepta-3-ene-1,7-dioic acid hydratase (Catechol pathway) n=1 Tax=Microbacterium saccharophilum TaxID=1213358 RepID=A0A7Z7GE29_9MICO|nr:MULTISPECIES: fumarylacetoacetate hydrolase family protein [Microbacterium]SFI61009.1 2-keto-4-pentenoate hydratase/2-oxohepta-3-ene-1,7-dioic acid hydratase (catechol pathway) [Microbacterium saccharophilum]
MRYASFVTPSGSHTWGAEIDGVLYDLGPTGTQFASTLKDALNGRELPAAADIDGAPSTPVDAVKFLPVIVDPTKIICVGVNYRAHQEETGRGAPSAPTVFTRFADSQMGHLQPAVRPATTEQFDYEGELALVIGARAHRVDAADAWDVIAGYAAYNDFSVRDWQRATTQWIPGKNFPDTGAFGPYFVPAADIPDITALTLETRVNGEIRQSATLADLVFTIPQLIEYITAFTPLSPGDVIVTGTPGGVGLFMTPTGLLSAGDVVDVEITGLGVLTNTVVQG